MNMYYKRIEKEMLEVGQAYDETCNYLIQLAEKNGGREGECSKEYREAYNKAVQSQKERIVHFKESMSLLLQEYEQALSKWAVTDSRKLDQEDIELMESHIDLNAQEYNRLIEKHATNYTMLQAIQVSAKSNDIQLLNNRTTDTSLKLETMRRIVKQAILIVSDFNRFPFITTTELDSYVVTTENKMMYNMWVKPFTPGALFKRESDLTAI